MRKLLVALLLLPVLSLGAFMAVTAGEGSWMDMENCEFCKSLTEEDPALLKNSTWEHYDISEGLVSVGSVAPAYLAHYRRASERMAKLQEKIMKGEDVKLCNMCIAFVDILQSGKVKVEHVTTSNGFVNLTMSDDPQMVDRIHKWGERTRTEMAMMEAESKPKTEMTKKGH